MLSSGIRIHPSWACSDTMPSKLAASPPAFALTPRRPMMPEYKVLFASDALKSGTSLQIICKNAAFCSSFTVRLNAHTIDGDDPSANAWLPIFLISAGIVSDVRRIQPANARLPIVRRAGGSTRPSPTPLPSNALSQIVRSDCAKSTVWSDTSFWNAAAPM